MHELKFIKCALYFIENPYKETYLRELAKKTKTSPFAVKKYCELLLREGLIVEERKANLRYFKANTSNRFYRQLKIAASTNEILKSGLPEFLKENVSNVSSITLFGSVARGENDSESDVDILIIGKQKALDLRKFEEKLDKEINTHIFSWAEWNRKAKGDGAFYFEVITDGIALFGQIPAVKWK